MTSVNCVGWEHPLTSGSTSAEPLVRRQASTGAPSLRTSYVLDRGWLHIYMRTALRCTRVSVSAVQV